MKMKVGAMKKRKLCKNGFSFLVVNLWLNHFHYQFHFKPTVKVLLAKILSIVMSHKHSHGKIGVIDVSSYHHPNSDNSKGGCFITLVGFRKLR